ncbi:MAG: DUF4965 domain-containing protein [Planctomycetes bacterium]|nr:DUF4965 domain-containing protein [Planctomycetota bacterium]
MRLATWTVLSSWFAISSAGAAPADLPPLRPPAVPLVACDPYFSIWSFADRLTDDATRHWTGTAHPLASLIRIDGKPFRLMGTEPEDVPALPQVGLEVLPTRTIYTFEGAGARIDLTFLTPALPDDLDVFSRPVTYLTWEVRAAGDARPSVSLYVDASVEIAVNDAAQEVVWSRPEVGGLRVLRAGTEDQPVLAKKGDNLRIDWGYLYAAAPARRASRSAIASGAACREAFARAGELPSDDARMPRPAKDETPVLAFAFDLDLGAGSASRTILLAYDDIHSIEYFRRPLRPYWRRNGADAADLLRGAARERAALRERAIAFDEELMADLRAAGGERYARICALAYRQATASGKLAADANGMPLFFPKENFSNGCIATVDVIYPMAPQFILTSPALLKASIANVLEYARSDRWAFPFAPHDLGTYPKANGQVYGGGERTEANQMPVEETGNMVILLAALARAEGNAAFAAQYADLLDRWAEYLKSKGLDPENQLCTDDFAGHLAHNVNLSAKAILALGAYGIICGMRGDRERAETYRDLSRAYAERWVEMADDGDHYRLAFDKPGTWSQKYNLVWDRILGLSLFPPEVVRNEVAHYRKVQNRYGLPLDVRKTYTKLDWAVWTASLAPAREDFDALIAPIYAFLHESPTRIPMTDWYDTITGKAVGFRARPVVGGVFVAMLADEAIWKKWRGRGANVKGEWAPVPERPTYVTVVPTAEKEAIAWRYTFERPAGDWFAPKYDASSWKEGPAGFGTSGTPGAVARTQWRTGEIWLRRTFALDAVPKAALLRVHHDEDAQVYINGILACRARGYTTGYEEFEIRPEAAATFRRGTNTIAVHCRQTTGGQYIDAGLVEVK